MALCGKSAVALAALLMAQVSSPAAAANPSFACTGDLAPAEKVICADDALAALDVALAVAYKTDLDGLPRDSADALDETRGGLVFTQQAWLAHRNACGTDKACIRKAYVLRTGELTAGANAPDVPCRDTVGAKEAAVLVKQCTQVATETHPPCNADNTCELIISHNINRCTFLGDGAPKFCAAYAKR